ncbi:hypothetical protein KBC03_05980 [Patescibacteria group bacterium]|nr:hypothetical protein [Patescibacteria group bacterium]
MRFIGTVVSYFANTEVQRGKDNYDIPQIDSYAEQKIVMNKLESGEFLCYLHGNYNEQIKAALSDLTTGRVRDALQHLKSIRPEV